MTEPRSRICAFCFDIGPMVYFPPDRRTKDGYAHYCKKCVDEIASDRIYRIGRCIICEQDKQINRKVCLECKKVVITVNTYHQFWDRRLYFSKMMWLSERIQQMQYDLGDEEAGIASRVRSNNFRAVLNQHEGLLDRHAVQFLWIVQSNMCAYTRKPITLETAHLDHMRPLSRGGSNTIENVVFVDASINLRKQDRTVLEFCQHHRLKSSIVRGHIMQIQSELYMAQFIKKLPGYA